MALVLDDIAKFYEDLNEIKENRFIKRYFKHDFEISKNQLFILIVGDHSTGKSSFINWYFGKEVQKIAIAIETSLITFITTGQKEMELDGPSTLKRFKFLENTEIPGFSDALSTKIIINEQNRSPLVTFIDTPGLLQGNDRLPFDNEKVLIELAKYADLIFCFMDPIGQAFSDSFQSFVQKCDSLYRNKMSFYLAKADYVIHQTDKIRILSSITQTLTPLVQKRTIDVRTIFIPHLNPNDDSNQINYTCEIIDSTVSNLLQKSVSSLHKDVSEMTRAAESSLSYISTYNRIIFLVFSVLSFFVTMFLMYKIKGKRYKKFKKLYPILILLSMFIVMIVKRPLRKEKKQIKDYIKITSKRAAVKVNEFYLSVSNDIDV